MPFFPQRWPGHRRHGVVRGKVLPGGWRSRVG